MTGLFGPLMVPAHRLVRGMRVRRSGITFTVDSVEAMPSGCMLVRGHTDDRHLVEIGGSTAPYEVVE